MEILRTCPEKEGRSGGSSSVTGALALGCVADNEFAVSYRRRGEKRGDPCDFNSHPAHQCRQPLLCLTAAAKKILLLEP